MNSRLESWTIRPPRPQKSQWARVDVFWNQEDLRPLPLYRCPRSTGFSLRSGSFLGKPQSIPSIDCLIQYNKLTMTPQLKEPPAGFRYTPSSYLHRVPSSSSRSENKPWNSSSNRNRENNSVDQEEEDLFSSRSPTATTKKSSNIDAHFVSDRMQKRKDLYRGIIKGDYEIVDRSSSSLVVGGDADSSSPEELLIKDVEYSLSVLSQQEESTAEDDEGYVVTSEQARQARQRRLSSGTVVVAATTAKSASGSAADSEATKARTLRAQRLRQVQRESLQDDEDVVEKLRQRRLEQIEEERRLLKAQAEQEAKDRVEEDRLKQERALLAEERRLLEQEKRKQARALDERRLHGGAKKQSKNGRQQPDPPGDYSLIEEVQMLMRESGVFRTCVSSCFGDDEDDLQSASTSRRTDGEAFEPPSLRSKVPRHSSFSSKNGTRLLSLGSGLSDLQLDESGNVMIPEY